MTINEFIDLRKNEGLEIDFSRIEYNAEQTTGQPSRPSWVQAHITYAEIVSSVAAISVANGVVRFTEDDLEIYLKQWLEYHFNCGIKSFRWVWDCYRDYKAS